MNGTRINQLRHGHLLNPSQALVKRMSNDGKNERMTYGDETVYRIVNNLSFWIGHAVAELLIKVVFRTSNKIINSLAIWQLHRYYG